MNRRLSLLSLAVAAAFAALPTAAQAQADYPNKPIKLIVDGPAGGINDIWARRYTNVMGQAMKQTFIIDNRTGASARWQPSCFPRRRRTATPCSTVA
jgi:tripartite-type tricarboxylate transporter receptor subunit TctC